MKKEGYCMHKIGEKVLNASFWIMKFSRRPPQFYTPGEKLKLKGGGRGE